MRSLLEEFSERRKGEKLQLLGHSLDAPARNGAFVSVWGIVLIGFAQSSVGLVLACTNSMDRAIHRVCAY